MMKIRSNILICLQLLVVPLIYVFSGAQTAAEQYYYAVNAYGENDSIGFPQPLKIVFVNLDTKLIAEEIIFGDQGELLNKKPLPIEHGSETLLVSAANAGCYCDNAVAGNHYLVVGIVNPRTMSLVYSYPDSNLFLAFFEKQPLNRVYLSGSTIHGQIENVNGDYILDLKYRFLLKTPRPIEYCYVIHADIGPIQNIEPLDSNMLLYGGSYLNASYIIKTDSLKLGIQDTLRLISNSVVVDSLLPTSFPAFSHIIGFSDTIIYDFNLNYEYYSKFLTKPRDLGRIESHAMLYNLNTFRLLTSLPVADYPPEEYPDEAFDTADLVGPYFVYYFFGSQGLDIRAPAMLFIFDTRTNEATWLRVGWR